MLTHNGNQALKTANTKTLIKAISKNNYPKSLKTSQSSHFCGNPLRNNGPLKIFESCVLFVMFFLKKVKEKVVSFVLVKNMGKEFSNIKNWNNTDHPSQNYRLSDLLFHFTDSYVCHPN